MASLSGRTPLVGRRTLGGVCFAILGCNPNSGHHRIDVEETPIWFGFRYYDDAPSGVGVTMVARDKCERRSTNEAPFLAMTNQVRTGVFSIGEMPQSRDYFVPSRWVAGVELRGAYNPYHDDRLWLDAGELVILSGSGRFDGDARRLDRQDKIEVEVRGWVELNRFRAVECTGVEDDPGNFKSVRCDCLNGAGVEKRCRVESDSASESLNDLEERCCGAFNKSEPEYERISVSFRARFCEHLCDDASRILVSKWCPAAMKGLPHASIK